MILFALIIGDDLEEGVRSARTSSDTIFYTCKHFHAFVKNLYYVRGLVSIVKVKDVVMFTAKYL